jgi:thiamine kinase-like enzyme
MVIADMARLHAAFWDQGGALQDWDWLLRPTAADAERLLADGRAGLEKLNDARAWDDILTPERTERLLTLARQPHLLLDILNAGPQTLLHGDAGFQNIAIAQDGGRRIWYDWQLTGWGPAALDWATFLHPWGYPEADPPLSVEEMTSLYLHALRRRGVKTDARSFAGRLDAAFLWRWLIQWGPLLSTYRERLRPDVRQRLGRAFEVYHWPALARMFHK